MPEEAQVPSLTDMFSTVGFVEVGGHQVQVGIGDIAEKGDFVDVEVMPGCSEVGLLHTMKRILNYTGKSVRAEFNGKPVLVEPDDKSKK